MLVANANKSIDKLSAYHQYCEYDIYERKDFMKEVTYDDNVNIWKDAYTNIVRVCEKYPEFRNKYSHSFNDIDTMLQSAKDHLLLIEWYETYGLKIEHDYKPYSNNWLNIGDHIEFLYFNDAQKEKDSGAGGRYISWPDDGRQPLNEWCFALGFPTGAYIFGRDYEGQQQLFQDFIEELKSYKPDYLDSVNKNFYWKLENAKPIYEAYDGIVKKYRERNTQELKIREVEKLSKQLSKLASEIEESTANHL